MKSVAWFFGGVIVTLLLGLALHSKGILVVSLPSISPSNTSSNTSSNTPSTKEKTSPSTASFEDVEITGHVIREGLGTATMFTAEGRATNTGTTDIAKFDVTVRLTDFELSCKDRKPSDIPSGDLAIIVRLGTIKNLRAGENRSFEYNFQWGDGEIQNLPTDCKRGSLRDAKAKMLAIEAK